ncbi:MAG: cytochrome c3 family protein [Phycisphaerales bacterium]|nr:cytochrome c3 family protein [Phycisphaerales bacterium]
MKLRTLLVATTGLLLAGAARANPDSPYDKLPAEGCLRCHTCPAPTKENPSLLICARLVGTPNKVEDGPDIVILDQLVDLYLPVPFDHRGHARMAEMTRGCATCHHYTPEGMTHPACRTCHDATSAGTDIAKPGLKGAYHRQCLNCHREWTDEKDCVKCHAPKAGASGDADTGVTKDDLLGRMHPPIPEPDTEIYRAEARESAGALVIFRHREHVHRFGLTCVECHHEDNCTRCHTEGNGHSQRERTVAEHHKPCLACHACDMDETCSSKERCQRCHWKPNEPRPKSFDHADTGWPLNRYHRDHNCRECHKAVPFAKVERSCNGCHKGWTPENFDHTITGQGLDERHAETDCGECHRGRDFTAPPVCTECHDEEVTYPAKRPGPQVSQR